MLLNRLLCLLLALAMTATTGTMAAQRDAATGAQRIVICTGLGPQMILVGADGEALDPAPICPDATLTLTHTAAAHPSRPLTPATILPRNLARDPQFQPARLTASLHARAPPVFVI